MYFELVSLKDKFIMLSKANFSSIARQPYTKSSFDLLLANSKELPILQEVIVKILMEVMQG